MEFKSTDLAGMLICLTPVFAISAFGDFEFWLGSSSWINKKLCRFMLFSNIYLKVWHIKPAKYTSFIFSNWSQNTFLIGYSNQKVGYLPTSTNFTNLVVQFDFKPYLVFLQLLTLTLRTDHLGYFDKWNFYHQDRNNYLESERPMDILFW